MLQKTVLLVVFLGLGFGLYGHGQEVITRTSVSPPSSESYVRIDGEDILKELRRYFPEVRIWGAVDDVYESVPVGEMERFLEEDLTNMMFVGRTYKEREFLDLDDYAATLWGHMSEDYGWERVPFGIIGRGKKGYNIPEKIPLTNIFVTKEGNRVVLYEINPMTDKIEKITYRHRDVLVVIL
jgi:hypothetical protein